MILKPKRNKPVIKQGEDNIKLDVVEVATYNNLHVENSNSNLSFAI
jgi:hypothetical protein